MTNLVLDTHVLIWYFYDAPLISDPANNAINASLAALKVLYVSPISLAEILLLEEKRKINTGTLAKIQRELDRPDSVLVEAPFVAAMMEAMARIPRNIVPELPDRIIAATALHLGVPLITADHEIRAANVVTIW